MDAAGKQHLNLLTEVASGVSSLVVVFGALARWGHRRGCCQGSVPVMLFINHLFFSVYMTYRVAGYGQGILLRLLGLSAFLYLVTLMLLETDLGMNAVNGVSLKSDDGMERDAVFAGSPVGPCGCWISGCRFVVGEFRRVQPDYIATVQGAGGGYRLILLVRGWLGASFWVLGLSAWGLVGGVCGSPGFESLARLSGSRP